MGGGGFRYYCITCNSRLIRVCDTCSKGLMKLDKYPDLGDFNQDGFPDAFCQLCGMGFKILLPGNNGNGYSKRRIRLLVHSAYVLKNYDFSDKKEFLDNLYKECDTFDEAISYISKKLRVKESFIRHRM